MANADLTVRLQTAHVEDQAITRAARMRGIRLTFLYNSVSAIFLNITAGAVVTGYALYLGATNYHIGLLSSVPNFAQVMQAVSPVFTERLRYRKPIHALCNLLAYLTWLPIAFIPFFISEALRPWAMIFFVGLSGIVIGVGGPAGISWITDLIPPDMLGWFYARVTTLLTVVGMVTAIAAGRYVDSLPQPFNFSSLFVIAVVTAVIGNVLLRFIPEPGKKTVELRGIAETFSLPFRNRNFRNLMTFFAIRSMAVMVAAPFFSVYWIKELKLSYSYIAVISSFMSLSSVASYQLWGYLSDKYGNKPVTKICWSGMCFIPITWFFVTRQNYHFAAPLAAAYGGIVGAGVVITQLNLRAKIAPEENRSVYMGCFNGVVCTASAIGPIIGGSLATLLKNASFDVAGIHVGTLKSLFLISSALRFACSPILWLVREDNEMPAQFILRQIAAPNPLLSFFHLIRFSRPAHTASRKDTARALGETRTRLAVEELIAALSDASWEVRREAARSLGEIGDPRAVDALLARLEDKEADIVEEATEALGKLRDPRALTPLVYLLDSERPSVRRSAAAALGNLSDDRATQYLETRLERETDPSVSAAVMEALSKSNKETARGGGTARTRLSVEELIAALSDTSWEVRREAARSLGESSDPRAVDALVARLDDAETDIVEEAAEALGRLGDSSALAPLAMLLDSDRPSVRRSAVVALGNLGNVKATRFLEKLLERETDQSVYATAIDALSKIGGPSSIHYFRNLLRNSKPGIFRRQLANSIGNLLGNEGEFYKLLEADEMAREARVSKIFTQARRRLVGRDVLDEDRDFIEIHLDAAILRSETGEYAGSIACFRKSGVRALRYFVTSEKGTQWLQSHRIPVDNIDDDSERIGALLGTNPHLKQNVGFLQGLDRESRSRQPLQEEMLLAIFALQQVCDELVLMRRRKTENGRESAT